MLYTEIFPTWTEDSYLSLGIPRPMGELDKRKVILCTSFYDSAVFFNGREILKVFKVLLKERFK